MKRRKQKSGMTNTKKVKVKKGRDCKELQEIKIKI